MAKKKKFITIGIDEVGRGPLAGPVTVAAVATARNYKLHFCEAKLARIIPNSKIKLRDSKKLSSLQREKWFKWIKKNKILYAVASVSPKIIDKINITNAANLAATKAFKKLIAKLKNCKIERLKVFLDGGLYLNLKPKTQNLKPKTIVRGDEKIKVIMLASIIAKVTRDKRMKKLHKKYSRYGFDCHKGYGTKKHLKAIKKNGVCKIHRRSFLKKILGKRKPRFR